MSELVEIKKRIFKEEKIEFILNEIGCWGINTEQRGELYVAGLPDGDNNRSVQVKNNEYLTSAIRSKGIKGDIYDIVSFVVFECQNESDRKNNLHRSKFWICQKLNYFEYIDEFYRQTADPIKQESTINKWLKDIQKKRHHDVQLIPNKVYDDLILKQYEIVPYFGWIDDGISYQTQKEFQVGIDIISDRIIFPVHNQFGELIGVKARYIGKDEKIYKNKKYMYLYPCNKSIELFNLHRALPYIKEKREVLIFEGAKTCMLSWQYGIKNCVSIEGDQLSPIQIKILKDLGLDIKHIFGYDKDKTVEFIHEQSKQLKGRLKYGLWDKNNLLGAPEFKRSPFDLGIKVFMDLYNNNCYKIG